MIRTQGFGVYHLSLPGDMPMLRIRMISLVLAVCLSGAPAAAEGFRQVASRDEFVGLVKDRELRLGRFNVWLSVLPDGAIKGSALGWGITGSWNWQEGYFCREMDWSGYAVPFNCQLVEAHGSDRLRFTVDRGAGDSASFRRR